MLNLGNGAINTFLILLILFVELHILHEKHNDKVRHTETRGDDSEDHLRFAVATINCRTGFRAREVPLGGHDVLEDECGVASVLFGEIGREFRRESIAPDGSRDTAMS